MAKEQRTCRTCDYPVRSRAEGDCPKCGEPLQLKSQRGLLEVDIAHNGQNWDSARTQLLKAVEQGVADGHSGVKVIHGRGQGGNYATIKEMAKAYLSGMAVRYRGKVSADRDNPGATILWFG